MYGKPWSELHPSIRSTRIENHPYLSLFCPWLENLGVFISHLMLIWGKEVSFSIEEVLLGFYLRCLRYNTLHKKSMLWNVPLLLIEDLFVNINCKEEWSRNASLNHTCGHLPQGECKPIHNHELHAVTRVASKPVISNTPFTFLG